MGISKLLQKVLLRFHPRAGELDSVLDRWISEALIEEAVAQPSQGAWDRLRSALERRRSRRHGMWVLDEPLRDPPESLPMVLTYAQFRRAERLYVGSRPNPRWYVKDNMFNYLVPTFYAVINY